MSKIKTCTIFQLLCIGFTLSGQPYEHAAGIRAGYSSGIAYKGFFRYSENAIEADALYNRHGFGVSALYVHHLDLFRKDRWLLYFGGGAFSGNWEKEFSAGLVAIGGIEFVVRDLPLNLGLDWRPMMNIFRLFEIDPYDFGVCIRYRFNL